MRNGLTVVHGGGRGSFGPIGRLFALKEDLSVYVVEADLENTGMGAFRAASIRASEKCGVVIEIVPGCLGSIPGQEINFLVHREPSASGTYPISDFARRLRRISGNGRDILHWDEACEVLSMTKLQTTTVDDMVKNGLVEQPDVLSLDIQGSEYKALLGSWHSLENVLAVVTEAELLPMYQAQPLLGDIQDLLWDKNFFLAGFETQEQWYSGRIYGRGFQAVTEAIFLKQPEFLAPEDRLKLAYVAGAFEFLGTAYDICKDVVDNHHDVWETFLARGNHLSAGVRDTFVSLHKILGTEPDTH